MSERLDRATTPELGQLATGVCGEPVELNLADSQVLLPCRLRYSTYSIAGQHCSTLVIAMITKGLINIPSYTKVLFVFPAR